MYYQKMPVFSVRVVDPPGECLGMTNVELYLQTPSALVPGTAEGSDLRFEVPFTMRPDRSGVPQPSGDVVHRESDGRRFIYLVWLGDQDGRRESFRRLKVYFDLAPGFPAPAETYSVSIRGRDAKGLPACARAQVYVDDAP